MTLEAIADKVLPTVIVVIIMAIFGLFMRVSYLEYIAESYVERYTEDVGEVKDRLNKLESEVRSNREEVIRMKVGE